MDFKFTFQTLDRDRDKFLSRLLGLFSEEVIDVWGKTSYSPYTNLGRPTLKSKPKGEERSTLDFLFCHKQTGKKYVVEMKCWLAYDNYKFLELNSTDQLAKINSPSFKKFLRFAKNPGSLMVKTQDGVHDNVDGAILIWGKVNPGAIKRIKEDFGFVDIISLEEVITTLVKHHDENYSSLVQGYSDWCKYLFDALVPIDTTR